MEIGKVRTAIEKYGKRPDRDAVDILGGVSEDLIHNAEKELGFQFCEDYRDFLSHFGCIDARITFYYGIMIGMTKVIYECVECTKEFFSEHYSGSIPYTTVLTQEDDWEWVVLLDHKSGLVTPYDPFAQELVQEQSLNLEDYLIQRFSGG